MDYKQGLSRIKDAEIRQAVSSAIELNLLPALREIAYPGHFCINADGGQFGAENTWPGLDSLQMAGAFLLMDMVDPVLKYFDFVKASQRADGNIPFAIFPEEGVRDPEARSTCLCGMNYPDDVFSYTPPNADPEKYPTREWIGLFDHWVPENPLNTLGSICYLLTAGEIFEKTADTVWLTDQIDSIERAAKYIVSRKSDQGLIGGGGFYTELPPRMNWDGITQCYTYKGFCYLVQLYTALGNQDKAEYWQTEANSVYHAFRANYWVNDHFAAYVSPSHGPVAHHGYSDVDFAAIAFGLADSDQINILWDALKKQKDFWLGDMPTQVMTKYYNFMEWELSTPPSFDNGERSQRFFYDLAAMGRVWYLESKACMAMGDYERLFASTKLVSQSGNRYGGYWHERYHPVSSGIVVPTGPPGYCEYPAILVRTVFSNPDVFMYPEEV